MPFVPHTESDVREMLAVIGARDIETLFDEIPPALKVDASRALPAGMSEMAIMRLMRERAESDGRYLNFIGAGACEHHIPAAVWQIATRGEFYSAYTPYQAEASQGTLQALYEFQTMMTALTGLDVSNASLYDGASALAEAVLMAVRAAKGAGASSRRVLMPRALHPRYRRVVATITGNQGVELVDIDYSRASGATPLEHAAAAGKQKFAALVIAQPNFFGVLEDAGALTDWAHSRGALVIGLVNPLALALLAPPGEWGADIAVGDGQPFGAPLSGGGPYFGFLCATERLLRQMPGRIVGRTVDARGRPGYCLTLQAREQHIRRAKATSNICTNQSLTAIAAAIHLSLLGPAGLDRTARACHANALALRAMLGTVPGVAPAFSGPVFHEIAMKLPRPAALVLGRLRGERILGGFDLAGDYPELGDALLLCATETKTEADLDRLVAAIRRALEAPRC